MNHCRSFLRGLKIGVLASPLMGILSVVFFLIFNPQVVQSEIGPYPALIEETMFCSPVSALLGALVGAIVDARRDRQTPQILTIWLLLLAVVPVSVIWSAFWFVRLVGERWLYEHGLYFGQ